MAIYTELDDDSDVYKFSVGEAVSFGEVQHTLSKLGSTYIAVPLRQSRCVTKPEIHLSGYGWAHARNHLADSSKPIKLTLTRKTTLTPKNQCKNCTQSTAWLTGWLTVGSIQRTCTLSWTDSTVESHLKIPSEWRSPSSQPVPHTMLLDTNGPQKTTSLCSIQPGRFLTCIFDFGYNFSVMELSPSVKLSKRTSPCTKNNDMDFESQTRSKTWLDATELIGQVCCWTPIWLDAPLSLACRGYLRYRNLIDWCGQQKQVCLNLRNSPVMAGQLALLHRKAYWSVQ